MTGWPDKPVIYEINTAIWLGDLSRAAGRRVTLADVPARPGTMLHRMASTRCG